LAITTDSPVSALRGVGPAKTASLAAVGIATVNDLIRHYPRAPLQKQQSFVYKALLQMKAAPVISIRRRPVLFY